MNSTHDPSALKIYDMSEGSLIFNTETKKRQEMVVVTSNHLNSIISDSVQNGLILVNEGCRKPGGITALINYEKDNMWDRLIEYGVIVFAVKHGRDMDRSVHRLQILLIFILLFVCSVYLKSKASVIVQTMECSDAGHMTMRVIHRICNLIFSYVGFLLVKIIMDAISSGISDGQWSIESLFIPVQVFILFYIIWQMSRYRSGYRS